VSAIVEVLPDASALFEAAADRFVQIARAAIERRGRFTVALSGGSTPRGLYSRIAMDAAHVGAVSWRHVEFFWGDERPVAPDHPESNYRMAREALLDHLPVADAQVHRIRGESPPAQAAEEYESEIARVLGVPPGTMPRFDLVLLGLGPDGHTASLVPGTTALTETRRVVVANYVPKFGVDRITLTAPAINAAHAIVFLAEGEAKAARLREVIEGPRDTDRLPAQLIHPTDGSLMWLVDAAAASQLSQRT
jgi:6-phosphogluconolactonase